MSRSYLDHSSEHEALLPQAVAEQETKLKAERARDRRKSKFRAAPLPRFAPPPPLDRSERPATRALTPKLAVETRSTARAAFDAMVAENKLKEEVHSFGYSFMQCASATADRLHGQRNQ